MDPQLAQSLQVPGLEIALIFSGAPGRRAGT